MTDYWRANPGFSNGKSVLNMEQNWKGIWKKDDKLAHYLSPRAECNIEGCFAGDFDDPQKPLVQCASIAIGGIPDQPIVSFL